MYFQVITNLSYRASQMVLVTTWSGGWFLAARELGHTHAYDRHNQLRVRAEQCRCSRSSALLSRRSSIEKKPAVKKVPKKHASPAAPSRHSAAGHPRMSHSTGTPQPPRHKIQACRHFIRHALHRRTHGAHADSPRQGLHCAARTRIPHRRPHMPHTQARTATPRGTRQQAAAPPMQQPSHTHTSTHRHTHTQANTRPRSTRTPPRPLHRTLPPHGEIPPHGVSDYIVPTCLSVPRLGGLHPAGGRPHVSRPCDRARPYWGRTRHGRRPSPPSCALVSRGSNPKAHKPAGWRGGPTRIPTPRKTRGSFMS